MGGCLMMRIDKSGKSLLFVCFMLFNMVFLTMTVLSGCTNNTGTNPLRVQVADENGSMRIGITSKIETPLSYAPAFAGPWGETDVNELTEYDDPVTMSKLEQLTIYISKIEAFAESGKSVTIFESGYVEEGRLKIRENFDNRYYAGWTSTAAPAGTYSRIDITIREVQAKWRNDYNEETSWFDHSYNRTLRLHAGKHFTSFTLNKHDYMELDTVLFINDRIGKSTGEFEPGVYAVVKTHKTQ